MRRGLALMFFMAVMIAGGCGYTTGSLLPPSLKTVAVEPFKNDIVFTNEGGRALYFPLLEVKVRSAVIDRFQVDGHLKIADKGASDLLLKGRLIAYQRDALRYTDNDDVQEYRVRIMMALEMWNKKTNELEWKEDSFAGEATYFLVGSQVRTEDAAVQDAIVDLSRRIVERTIENW